jgi:Peptidase A4 family
MSHAADNSYKAGPDDPAHTQQQYAQIWSEIEKRVTFAKASPKPDFNPLAASDDELESFKLPPRPDARSSPYAFANWRRAMSPPLRFIPNDVFRGLVLDLKNLFTIDVSRRQRPQLASDSAELSNNWSGATIRDDLGETYDLVQGTWMVPRPYPPPPRIPGGLWSHGDFSVSVWIGLDGHDPGSLSLPQIGTTQVVSAATDTDNPSGLTVSVTAWWEWWFKDDPTSHQIDIPAALFPVQIGDVICAQLNVLNPTTVRAFIKNLSSGLVYPGFDLTPPTVTVQNPAGPVKVEGQTAEWIVERQTKPMSTAMLPFCNFGAVVFTGCNAQVVTAGGTSGDRQLQRARTIRMSDWTLPSNVDPYQPGMQNPGIIVSTPMLEGVDSVLLTYTGGSP